MNFIGFSRLNLLLEIIFWVAVAVEAVAPIGAAVPIVTAMAAALYTAY